MCIAPKCIKPVSGDLHSLCSHCILQNNLELYYSVKLTCNFEELFVWVVTQSLFSVPGNKAAFAGMLKQREQNKTANRAKRNDALGLGVTPGN